MNNCVAIRLEEDSGITRHWCKTHKIYIRNGVCPYGRIAELEAAARTLVQNAEFDGDISTVDTEDIKILKELLA